MIQVSQQVSYENNPRQSRLIGVGTKRVTEGDLGFYRASLRAKAIGAQ